MGIGSYEIRLNPFLCVCSFDVFLLCKSDGRHRIIIGASHGEDGTKLHDVFALFEGRHQDRGSTMQYLHCSLL